MKRKWDTHYTLVALFFPFITDEERERERQTDRQTEILKYG